MKVATGFHRPLSTKVGWGKVVVAPSIHCGIDGLSCTLGLVYFHTEFTFLDSQTARFTIR
jgi:hypothetical protein